MKALSTPTSLSFFCFPFFVADHFVYSQSMFTINVSAIAAGAGAVGAVTKSGSLSGGMVLY